MTIEPQAIEQLIAAVNKQTELLAEMVMLLRKSEERQAHGERLREVIRSAQVQLADGIATGRVAEAMKQRGVQQ